MADVWFTADTHLGHARIIELCGRPFQSVKEMDDALIQLWNATVKPGDTVIHVGDFAFADHTGYLMRLNGQKHLVRGNHDHSKLVKAARGWVDGRLSQARQDRRGGDRMLPLCDAGLAQRAPRRAARLRPQPRQPRRRFAIVRRRR